MAGKVVLSTLNDSSGVLATQNGMTGIAKAWVNFNGTGTVAIRDSFNVSSITDNGTGDYTVNYTTAMPNSNYSCVASTGYNFGVRQSAAICVASGPYSGATESAPTTTSIRMTTQDSAGAFDAKYVMVAIFSS